jgi:hypothetical protein
MIGRKVKSAWHRLDNGEVIAWEPLGHAMCDALVRQPDGSVCWYASSDLKPADDSGPLPSRAEAREKARVKAVASLNAILANHVRDFHKPWPGCEFGKAHFGNMIIGAIEDLEGKGKK